MEGDHGLARSGASLNDEDSIERMLDDVVLSCLNRLHDLVHFSSTASVEFAQQSVVDLWAVLESRTCLASSAKIKSSNVRTTLPSVVNCRLRKTPIGLDADAL